MQMALPSNVKAFAIVAAVVGLAATNVLTLLDDEFHGAAFGIVAGAIRQVFPCEQVPVSYSMIVSGPAMLHDCEFWLRNSPTFARKREVEGAAATLRAQVAKLENQVAMMTSEIRNLTEWRPGK
jgi:hypothetical protein